MNSGLKGALIAAGLIAAFISGAAYRGRFQTPATAKAALARYYCPMHPQYTSDRPGRAPCCGMRLEPIPHGSAGVSRPAAHPAALQIPADRQQLIGIRVAAVEKAPGPHTIRTSGQVAPDETKIYSLNTSAECWIRRVYPPTTGSLVRKDEPLAAFYSNNFLAAAQAYLYALATLDRHKELSASNPDQMAAVEVQVRQAVESLQNLGVTAAQIEEIARTRKLSDLVTVRAPVTGFILARNVTPGQWIGEGTEMYRIADLSHVWILADLFEQEGQFVAAGQKAKVVYHGRGFPARVSQVPPQFDPSARTLKVRLEMDNPGYALRPGMFVDVEFMVSLSPAITVPADAVVDSGLRKIVYVERDNGYFEPRAVETGWRFGERVEVTRGLEPGESIVVAGNFLLDSECRMRAALAGAPAQKPKSATAVDPICGMPVEIATAKYRSQHQGKTYYFCAESCKKTFDRKTEPRP